jgi:regulatory protein SWI6
MQARIRQRQERKQKLHNLRQRVAEMRARIPGDESPATIQIGDADAEFSIEPASTPQHSSDDSQLPPPQIIQSRLGAYNSLNARLAAHVSSLKARDGELEAKYRRVIALCTGVEEKQVDTVLAQLVQAVESEVDAGQDVSRVREFLRRVEMVI